MGDAVDPSSLRVEFLKAPEEPKYHNPHYQAQRVHVESGRALHRVSRDHYRTQRVAVLATAAFVLGVIGTALGILNYRRDRPKLLVSLRWDAIVVRDTKGTNATFGQIYLTNTGRRPIYITSAGIEFNPPRAWWFTRTQRQGKQKGRKLAEGDPPLSLVVDATRLGADITRDHCQFWRAFRAFAEDSSGKRYFSPKVTQRPSWGLGDGRVPDYVTLGGKIIECDLEQHELEAYLMKGEWSLVSIADISEMREKLRAAGLNPGHYFSFENDPEMITIIGRAGVPSNHPS